MAKRQAIKNPHLFLCIALAIWCVFIQNARAETPPFKFYTTSDGLAHDRVNRIVRDSRGFLWFCTSEGLSRFDGYEFKNYTQDDGLPHRAVNDFLETRSGELWIATNDGLVSFNPMGVSKREQTNENKSGASMFRTVRPPDLKTELNTWSVEDLLEDRDGVIWAASSAGLFRLANQSADDWRLKRFERKEIEQGTGRGFLKLLEDQTGAIWGGNTSGLYRISPDRASAQILVPKLSLVSLLEDKDGQIWVGTGSDAANRGLRVYSYANDKLSLTRVFGKKDGLLSDEWINALLKTSDGRIFVGSGGLCEYAPQADPDKPQFRVLSRESIVALAEDAGGNIWFATASSGAGRIARNGFVSFAGSDGIKSKSVTSIMTGADGEIYILPEQRTISRFNGKGFDSVQPLEMMLQSWGKGQISFQDHLGEWWIAGTQGLQRYPKVGKFEDLAHTAPYRTYTTSDGLFANEVFQLFEDSRGDIWISIIGDVINTVLRWERATDTIHGYTTEDGIPEKNGAVAYGEDRAGNVWLGFYSGGLLRFHDGKFESFTAEDGLPPGYIHNIFTDSNGRIWVATSSSGVVRIENPATEEKPRLEHLTTREGLSSNQATCATEDNFGRIYISTGRGVNRLNLQTGRIKVFTKADGLPENIVTLCKRDAGGSLWFGTYNGLARYTPVADEQSKPPPVFLSNLRVSGESVKKLSELGETNIKNLDFASDQRQIQIDFFALGFGTGEALRYQYKLDGIDADWSEPTEQRTINLNLSSGKYQFLVRAVNADGIASENPASISFSIARPVWQRWWFLALLTLLAAGLIYVIYSYRLKRLLELEKVRTRIATDLHDDIGASLSKIAILSEVVHQRIAPVAPNSVEINQPLEEIAGTSRDLVDSMSDIVWAINPERDHLSDLLQRMRNLAGEMTEIADIGLRVHSSGVETVGEMALGADMRREIYLIFKETINNLVKHAACDMVEIEFRRESDQLIISVKDDGKGFDTSANGNGNTATRGGNGLPNMRRRAANLGGSCEISSEIGKGTISVLRVPLKSGLSLKNYFSKNKRRTDENGKK
jgi:ligand-binding sensor domain-containing protein/signal transduction histidine kinase